MSSPVSPVSQRPGPRTAPGPARLPWILVAALVFGAGVLCSAVLAWSFTLLVIGVVLTAGALLGTVMLLPHREVQRPTREVQ